MTRERFQAHRRSRSTDTEIVAGEEDPGRRARESDRESIEQNKGRAVPRFAAGEGDQPARGSEEVPGGSTCQSELPTSDRMHEHVVLNSAKQKEEAVVAKERKEKAWQRDHAYDDLHSADSVAMSSNQDAAYDSDDFM